jgi:SAM-dependent methyltransferase
MGEPLDFSQRANLEEEMDEPCPYEDMRDCLRDLAVVNRLVFTHRPILAWLDRIADSLRDSDWRGPLRIVDVGCGYGDMLRRIERWATRRRCAVELVGVDINANGLRAAREATPPASAIQYVLGDATACAETANADVIVATGMTHHLSEVEIVHLLEWMERTARVGWMVCDLHRKPMPYRLFSVAMRGPWWHRFIRPDGLRSIRRSFVAADWERMCAAAKIDPAARKIECYRPARLCVERTRPMPGPSQ